MTAQENAPTTGRPGLQAERTDLSWTRSALAFLVNGGLLLLRHDQSNSSPLEIAAVSIAFLLAVFTFAMARWRRRILRQRPLPEALAAPTPLLLLACGTIALGVVVFTVVLMS